MSELEKGLKLGLQTAAQYLETQAEGLVERAKELHRAHVVMFTSDELADLLRTQAEQIRKLELRREG
jgi:hypothetical protein